MQTREQYLLIKLAEEATEVAKLALKTSQFGFDSFHPGDPDRTNAAMLQAEISDLMAIAALIGEECHIDLTPNRDMMRRKVKAVAYYYEVSKHLSRVE